MIRLLILLPLLLLFTPNMLEGGAMVKPPVVEAEALTLDDIKTLSNREIGEKLGRKLRFGEKIGFSILRGKLKRMERRAAKGKPMVKKRKRAARVGRDGLPIVALVSSIVGLFFPFLLLVGLILGAISAPRNRDIDPERYKMAKWAFWIAIVGIIAWIVIATFALLLSVTV